MTTMKELLRASSIVALVAIAAGCQESTGPGSLSKLNTAAAMADYKAMDGVLQSSSLKAFQMTAAKMDVTKFGFAPVSAARITAALRSVSSGGDTRSFAAAMAGITGASLDGAASIPLISTGNRGKTFVYNATLHNWEVDPARTGAPSNGVRFITYEPKGAEPDPSKPIGHADLIDLGDTGSAIALRLVVAEGSLTVLDYRTTVEGSEGSGHVTVQGFVQNDHDKLDFNIDVRGQKVGVVDKADVSLELGIAARLFHVNGVVHSEKQGGIEHSTVDLTVRHGAASFRVRVANDANALSGTVDLNNSLFAKVSGTSAAPVFKNAAGDPIGAAEALVLWRIYEITDDVFDLFEELVEPVAGLIIAAVIL